MTKEELLAEQRAAFGLETPPAATPDANEPPDNTTTEPQQQAAPQQEPAQVQEPITELSDEALLQLLGKRGISVSSLEDLKKPEVPENPEVIAERRNADKLAYGIKNGLFKQKDYENYVVDAKDKTNLVFQEFYEAAKADDPEISDLEIQSAFSDKYHLNEEGTKKAALGLKELNKAANEILASKYGGIVSLDDTYTKYEASINEQKAIEKKIIEGAPQYKKDVDTIISETKTIKYKSPVAEIGEIEIEVPETVLGKIRENLLFEDAVKMQVLDGYSADNLRSTVLAGVIANGFDEIVGKAISQALLKVQKGTRGIVPQNVQPKLDEAPKLDEKQQAAVDEIRARLNIPAPVQ